jgi:hypothetical protein
MEFAMHALSLQHVVTAARRFAKREVTPSNVVSLESAAPRAMQIARGELIDISEIAMYAGFSVPVAMTDDTWTCCIAPIDARVSRQAVKQHEETIWQILLIAQRTLHALHWPMVLFDVPFGFEQDGEPAATVRIRLAVGVGDRGEAVITLSRPQVV